MVWSRPTPCCKNSIRGMPAPDQGPAMKKEPEMKTCRAIFCSISLLILSGGCYARAGASTTKVTNSTLTVLLQNRGAIYEVRERGLDKPVFSARIGAEVDHQWLWSTGDPQASRS